MTDRYRAMLIRRTGGDPVAMAAEDAALTKRAQQYVHGHVRPRADGMKARCGGPKMCAVCEMEQRALDAAPLEKAIGEPCPNGTPPSPGDRIEFGSDRQTDKGPATGVVSECKPTVDGYYVTVKFGDSQEQFSWEDLREHASKSGKLWLIKAMPTPAQAAAGNYKKPRIKWHGLEIAVEQPEGTVREGTDETGKAWRTEFHYAYGYFCRTTGVDGDEVDVFIGPDLSAPEVYIVRQMKRKDWDKYDEDKTFIGFSSMEAAKRAYLGHYDDPRFFGSIIGMPVDEFVAKVKDTKAKPEMLKCLLFQRVR